MHDMIDRPSIVLAAHRRGTSEDDEETATLNQVKYCMPNEENK